MNKKNSKIGVFYLLSLLTFLDTFDHSSYSKYFDKVIYFVMIYFITK
jgi:hypothetical protein